MCAVVVNYVFEYLQKQRLGATNEQNNEIIDGTVYRFWYQCL